MGARKKVGGRKAAVRKKAGDEGEGGQRSAARTKGTARLRSRVGERPPQPARPGASWLGERLTQLVEHAAAGFLRRAVDVGGAGVAALLPGSEEMRREVGAYVRELRELAGLTRGELAEALRLSDQSLLAAVEAGTATLSFELTLRLAAIIARHDPVPFVSRLARTYNPILWQLLEDWGIGELPLQLEREREFVNILRGAEAARALSDEDFAQVLAFTRVAFETALHFARREARPRQRAADVASKTPIGR
ncbi:MAG TPA: transcriptional regulator [Deltaproteobacteria bacterium]|jgi:transcriptional regulator with XRE-family HTH domain|nr:transcriptional regulator [Deltaproteobacteria bacterium]